MAQETTKQATQQQQPSTKRGQQQASNTPTQQPGAFPLEKVNFILIAVCVALIVGGFALMTGSANTGTTWNEDIFSPRRTVVAPMVALSGFALMIFAIMYQRKDHPSKD